MKDNKYNAQTFNLLQRNKFRDTHNYVYLSQDYVNTFSDYYLFNDDDKILYQNTTTSNVAAPSIILTFTIPLSELSPLFATFPIHPFSAYNSPIMIDIFFN